MQQEHKMCIVVFEELPVLGPLINSVLNKILSGVLNGTLSSSTVMELLSLNAEGTHIYF